jgi:hypothetical protein
VIESARVDCPYCGESYETTVDLSAGDQVYVEDCAVCCKPITLVLNVSDDGDFTLHARRDHD